MHMSLLLIYWETQEKRPIFVLNNEVPLRKLNSLF